MGNHASTAQGSNEIPLLIASILNLYNQVVAQFKRFIVMTGLPASGKTTLGRRLAEMFNFPFIDKDDILETLLSEHSEYSVELRQRLSRESDLAFQKQALQSQNAVLTSFWRAPKSNSTGGTASDWLPSVSGDIIEILCHCQSDIAVDRFLTRKRHPGHMDQMRDRATLEGQFKNLSSAWPLGFGRLIEVDTSKSVNAEEVFGEIRKFWPAP